MIIYNSTFCIDKSIERKWVQWMKDHYLTQHHKIKELNHYHFCKIFEDENPTGSTYAVQFFFKDLQAMQVYRDNYEPEFRLLHQNHFPDQFVTFNTLLEILDSPKSLV